MYGEQKKKLMQTNFLIYLYHMFQGEFWINILLFFFFLVKFKQQDVYDNKNKIHIANNKSV